MEMMYTARNAHKCEQQASAVMGAVLALLLGGLAVCIVLCTQVRTGMEQRLLLWIIGISTGTIWLSSMLYTECFLGIRRSAKHMRGILNDLDKEGTEEYQGILTVSPVQVQIPGSIRICNLSLADDNEKNTFHMDRRLKKLLPPAGSRVRILAVRGYVVGVEVLHENR